MGLFGMAVQDGDERVLRNPWEAKGGELVNKVHPTSALTTFSNVG